MERRKGLSLVAMMINMRSNTEMICGRRRKVKLSVKLNLILDHTHAPHIAQVLPIFLLPHLHQINIFPTTSFSILLSVAVLD